MITYVQNGSRYERHTHDADGVLIDITVMSEQRCEAEGILMEHVVNAAKSGTSPAAAAPAKARKRTTKGTTTTKGAAK